jgi:HEAT repeat protein
MNELDPTQVDRYLILLEDPELPEDVLYDIAHAFIISPLERAIEPLKTRVIRNTDPSWVKKELVGALAVTTAERGSRSQVKTVIDELLGIFSSQTEDQEVREVAATGLAVLKAERAVIPLMDSLEIALASSQYDFVLSLVHALGVIGDPRATNLLLQVLETAIDEKELLIPQVTIEALGEIGQPAEKALPALQRLARSGNPTEKRFALQAITNIRGESLPGSDISPE